MKIKTLSFVVALGLLCSVMVVDSPAQASHCGAGKFYVGGTYFDKTTGQPASAVATVRFFRQSSGQPQTLVGTTTTKLPGSTYGICLPSSGDRYFVTFHAIEYVTGQNPDYDVILEPVPSAGSHVTVNEFQARWVDLLQSELFFHRSDGLYRGYDPRTNGTLPGPLIAGGDWPQTGDWQFSHMPVQSIGSVVFFMLGYGPGGELIALPDPITYEDSGFAPDFVVDLGSDPSWDIVTAVEEDSILFYSSDGNFRFSSVFVNQPGPPCCDPQIGDTLNSGSGWTSGWTSIVPIDLDGDGFDELLFYRASDGLFRYYKVQNGHISTPLAAGDGYTTGWDSITALDLDGDNQDEIFFYRADGLFRFYEIKSNGALPGPMLAGSGYTQDWDSITRFESCRVGSAWECPFNG